MHYTILRMIVWLGQRIEDTIPDWKDCFLPAEDIFPRQICALGKTIPALSSPYEMTYFQAYFSNSARLIGRCAHGSLFACGRSSARTTYFPVWVQSNVYLGLNRRAVESHIGHTIVELKMAINQLKSIHSNH